MFTYQTKYSTLILDVTSNTVKLNIMGGAKLEKKFDDIFQAWAYYNTVRSQFKAKRLRDNKELLNRI